MVKAIFFDLDGTLLPMEQDTFVESYFSRLCIKLAPYGFDPKELVKNIWTGTKVMISNDGSVSNEVAFWNYFKKVYGPDVLQYEPIFREYYENEFQAVKEVCGFEAESAKLIAHVKALGYRIILATNPIFPQIATHSRIRWAGLDVNDFEYVTTYENASYAKPNPLYYQEILDKTNLKAEDCVMIGNDVAEDMVAQSLGMIVFLLTDHLISHQQDISLYPHGSFKELYAFIDTLKKG